MQGEETPPTGQMWTYEGIVNAIPGHELSPTVALLIQFAGFEAAILIVAHLYGLWWAVPVGTVAVLVAVAGSLQMLRVSALVRDAAIRGPYYRLLFGSRVEVVLSVASFTAVSSLLITGTGRATETLAGSGASPVPLALSLLIVWDLCYRASTAWWCAIVGLWRSLRCEVDEETRKTATRIDAEAALLSLPQLFLLPFLGDYHLLAAGVVGHVVAVGVVSGTGVLVALHQGQ